MSDTPLSPRVAVPLAHRKRRHSLMSPVDKAKDVEALFPAPEGRAANGQTNGRHVAKVPKMESTDVHEVEREEEGSEDEDVDEDAENSSTIEDLLDEAEIDPYHPIMEGEGVDDSTAASLRDRLLQDGIEKFVDEHVPLEPRRYRHFGTVFGLDPALPVSDEFFLKLLILAITRAFQKRQKLPDYNTIDDVAKLLRKSKSIMVITGAGISTSLGIPDFRSKETGFYSKLLARGYAEPEDVFDLHNFDYDPTLFYSLAAEILPDQKRYSPTHAFVRLLQDRQKLQTNYTQNIDNLEALVGIQKDRLIQCHGSFATATCRKCKHRVEGTEIFQDIRNKVVSRCKACKAALAATPATKRPAPSPKRRRFDADSGDEDVDDDIPEPGVMKPDITFFGEALPDNFFERFTERDIKDVDLVLVIGTSLKVAPVSELPNHLPHEVPHIYISREPITHVNFDVQLLGNCDDVVVELCRRAGWELRHRMIPPGCTMEVKEVENGGGFMWKVQRNEDRAVASGAALLRSPEQTRVREKTPLISPEKAQVTTQFNEWLKKI